MLWWYSTWAVLRGGRIDIVVAALGICCCIDMVAVFGIGGCIVNCGCIGIVAVLQLWPYYNCGRIDIVAVLTLWLHHNGGRIDNCCCIDIVAVLLMVAALLIVAVLILWPY